MGRPPLNVKPILVRLPDGVGERIDVLEGKNKRAEFIRDAVERELRERERRAGVARALDEVADVIVEEKRAAKKTR